VATPFVYRYSKERTAREVEAARYTPPPPTPPLEDDTKQRPDESLNAWLSRTQLIKAKKRVVGMTTVDAPPDNTAADAHADREHQLEVIKTARLERLEADGRLLPVASPTTNAFGDPIDVDGHLVDEQGNPLPDPCEATPEFDFTEPYWQSVCADHGIPAERCTEVLTTEQGIGSDEIHYEFALPEGCRP
jgi:hypothetical protein